jgi:hypothetical protein
MPLKLAWLRTAISSSQTAVRKLFHWKFASVFGVGLWLGGLSLMGSDKYTAALIFFVLGGLWMWGWWFVEHPAPKMRKGQTSWRKDQKKQIRVRWFGALGPLVITAVMCGITLHLREQKMLRDYSGPLYPGSKPAPPVTCIVPPAPNSLAVFLGGNVVTTKTFPYRVMRVNGEDLLIMRRRGNGLLLDFRAFDDRGDIIAKMWQTQGDENHYWVRPDARMERNDSGSLSVFDHTDHLALNVSFLNPSTVKVTGIFRASRLPQEAVIITDKQIQTPDGIYQSSGCYLNSEAGGLNYGLPEAIGPISDDK